MQEEAAEYFKRAGERARTLYANSEALENLRAALALGHPDAAAVHEMIGDLQIRMGDYESALSSLETAAARRAPQPAPQIERKLGEVYQRLGNIGAARSHYEAALGALAPGEAHDLRAQLLADLSLCALQSQRTEEAVALARESLEVAQGANLPRALARAHNMLGLVASKEGDRDTARGHLEQSVALSEQTEDLEMRVAALNNLALSLRSAGRLDGALRLTEEALSMCKAIGDRHREAALHNNMADLLHAAGREGESMQHLKEAVTVFADIGERETMQPAIWKLVEW
jgi:tetratricopeptide (TPR) repeat protein